MMKSTNDVYLKVLKDLNYFGMITNPRNMKVKELLGYKLIIEDPNDNIITLPGFETNIDYAKEELRWYYSGSNKIDFSPIIEKTWERFSDDGITAKSAYGYRIFGKHEDFMDQWSWCIDELKQDPDSRRCIININYNDDKDHNTKDMPCTVYIQVFIRDNKLHWITSMRSNDIYFGFRNDLYCFTEMQKKMAKQLNVKLGHYIHFAGSMHLYERHFKKVEALLNSNKSLESFGLKNPVKRK